MQQQTLINEANQTSLSTATEISPDFLRAMSHELRIPLNTIFGMAQIMKNKPLNFSEQQDCSKTILESGLDLLALINDIVDFSRSEKGLLKFIPEDTDLPQLLDQVIRNINHKAQLKNLQIVLRYDEDIPRKIVIDPQRTRQVLTNFIDNAIKFTEQGRILIHIHQEHFASNQKKYLRITITDTGCGIPEGQLKQLFHQDNPLHASLHPTRLEPELRLGLVKQLVELMGGQVYVTSKLGEGSEFSFTLPLLQPTLIDEKPLSFNLNGTPILIIDDNEVPTQLLQQQLIRMGIRTTIIPIANALTTLHASINDVFSYQIIIISAQVFDHHIAYLLRAIRSHHPLQNTLLGLALSSQPYDYEIENARSEGIACILNPLQPNNFRHTLSNSWKMWTEKNNVLQTLLNTPKKRVLLVEDNQLNQKVVKLMVENLGYDVEVAPNGKVAIQLFEEKAFDLVFMDLGLPDMHGLEVTVELREREREGQHTPIIALTAYTLEEVKQASFKAGVDDYLTKPLLQDKLISILDKWIKK